MIVLGIESATELVGVAVADDHGARAAVWATGRRRHGEALAPAVAHVLEQAEVGLGDLGAVAVDIGPGLFTGLRVGVATAKGLAQSLGIGVIGIESLDVLAHAAYDAGWAGPVLAVVDARRAEVFAARYERDDSGKVVQADPPARHTPEELAASFDARGARGTLAVGDGARRYLAGTAAVQAAGVRVAGASLASPPPGVLATLAVARLSAGATPLAPAAVVPVYLRDADVRINWVQRDA